MCRWNILHQNYEINYVVGKWNKLFDKTFETLVFIKFSSVSKNVLQVLIGFFH